MIFYCVVWNWMCGISEVCLDLAWACGPAWSIIFSLWNFEFWTSSTKTKGQSDVPACAGLLQRQAVFSGGCRGVVGMVMERWQSPLTLWCLKFLNSFSASSDQSLWCWRPRTPTHVHENRPKTRSCLIISPSKSRLSVMSSEAFGRCGLFSPRGTESRGLGDECCGVSQLWMGVIGRHTNK